MAHVQTPTEATHERSSRPTPRHEMVRTTCSREFAVGHLNLAQIRYPASRVTLSTDCLPDDRGCLWASLTPAEARRLAALLLAHAAEAEPHTEDATRIHIEHADADRYIVRIPGRHPAVSTHESICSADGGAVTDLLAAAVALDIARRAGRFLARHETRRDELRVTTRITATRQHAAHAGAVLVTVTTPPSLTGERKTALRTLLRTSVLRNPAWRALHIEIAVA
jgi:putative redox protein